MKSTTRFLLILFVLSFSTGWALANENFESAKEFFDAEEYKKAVGLLKKITKKDKSSTKAWILLAESYSRLGKYKKAVEAYQNAIQTDTENEEALFGLGITCSRMRKHSIAIDAFKKVIEINPKNALAHFELGVSYDNTASLTYAFEQYKILKKLDAHLADKLYRIILH